MPLITQSKRRSELVARTAEDATTSRLEGSIIRRSQDDEYDCDQHYDYRDHGGKGYPDCLDFTLVAAARFFSHAILLLKAR